MIRRAGVWLRALLRRDAVEREMSDEMQEHLHRATERLIARGLSPTGARAEALREFGNISNFQEEARDARGVRWIEDGLQDLKYAVRGLRLRPGFSAAVVVTLGLGIGANATMFGIVDRLLFRPPAYLIGPERSHHLYFARSVDGGERLGQAAQYRRFRDLAETSTAMDVVAAYAPRRLYVGAGETAREMAFGFASASLWQLFDAQPALGRFFTEMDDRDSNGQRVAVLSYGHWQSEYAGSADALGKTILIWPERYTIVGVAPRGFGGVELGTPDAFLPMAVAAADDFGASWVADRSTYAITWLEIYGRRKAGVTLEAAEADLTAAYRASYLNQFDTERQYTPPIDVAKPRVVLGSMLAQRGPSPSAESRVAAWLLGVTTIVLLIACANVGNLLLVRAVARRREIAIRVALGAGRPRLIRLLTVETLVLATGGGVLGLLVAHWGGHVVRVFLLPTVAVDAPIADQRILIFTALSVVAAAMVAGAAPIVAAARSDVWAALKTGERALGDRSRVQQGLMLAQASLSIVLLVGAGLFLKSVNRATDVHLGYDAERLIVAQIRLRTVQLDSARQVALRRALLARAEANPIVESATLVYSVPFSGTRTGHAFIGGVDSTIARGELLEQAASPTYFQTTGTRIIRGRGISASDGENAPPVVVVSEAMARAFWPGEDAIGKCMRRRSATAPCRSVIGIAENIKQASLGDDTGFMYYLAVAQSGEHEGRLLVRTRGEARPQVEALRLDLQRVMPPSSYIVARPMAATMSSVTRSWRLGATMFMVFGALALVLAAIGLYSVVAYAVARRTHEMGVRVALGATPVDVLALILRDALRVIVAGVVVGIVIALAAGPWIGPLLFDVSPSDPLVFVGVATVLLAVGVSASCVPARRVLRVDPSTALRSD